jgi:hypothetical protein
MIFVGASKFDRFVCSFRRMVPELRPVSMLSIGKANNGWSGCSARHGSSKGGVPLNALRRVHQASAA